MNNRSTGNITIVPGEEAIDQEDVFQLMVQRVKLLATRRIAWLQKIWCDMGPSGDERFTSEIEVEGCLSDKDDPALENGFYENEVKLEALNKNIAALDSRITVNTQSRLGQLRILFGLNQVEADIIQTCLCLHLDPNLGKVFAYLQDQVNLPFVTRQLVARLFRHGLFITLGSTSPLCRWKLISEVETGRGQPARIEMDSFVRDWLMGIDDIDQHIIEICHPLRARPGLPHWPVVESAMKIKRMLDQRTGEVIRVFVGADLEKEERVFRQHWLQKLGCHCW
ncbi:hypothetical protein [Hymenobacter volaticus]|uniref:Winged helix domain-containing protein n=1 Tax=Hymenobacter volaticus TaxID=2932254 RepID=A0ABY4G205_9BACT|nr:hypothetical protein [Hymenobacter volaticus]UOQ64820.1 hypothetical protein MUN86_14745 [Hymenobacter volaticus]